MHIRRGKRALGAVIPTATMADIAFLLIIFFMVTTAFSLDRTPMELPKTEEQEQTAKGAAIISITTDGQLRFSAGEEDAHRVDGVLALDGRAGGRSGAGVDHPCPHLRPLALHSPAPPPAHRGGRRARRG